MRLLFSVQRYGQEVAGGAELACRQFATRLAARGHEVEVVTSRATSYVDWSNTYPEGDEALDGVTVHRLGVSAPRSDQMFGPVHARVVYGRKPVPLFLQEEWMRRQGPFIPRLERWFDENTARFDAVIFFTYLYYTTWCGLRSVRGRAPTVLHPTAHSEPPFFLPLFDTTLRLPTAFGFLTEEEQALMDERVGRRPGQIFGIGIDLEASGKGDRFRATAGLDDRPYVLFLGRVDPGKGSEELFDYFTTYKRRVSGPLALVVLGDQVRPLPEHPDVIPVGFVSEQTKRDAIDGCVALIQPSYFESFSIVLAEAWAQRRPALVQGRCAVLEGQARRSGGGLPYAGYRMFETALEYITNDPQLRERFGEAGRSYVEGRYRWENILARYERYLEWLAKSWPRRRLGTR